MVHLLKPVWKCGFFDHTDDSKHNLPVFDNVLNRQFETAEPDHDWVARHDLCSHLHRLTVLAAVLDLYSRKLVIWTMARSMPAELAR